MIMPVSENIKNDPIMFIYYTLGHLTTKDHLDPSDAIKDEIARLRHILELLQKKPVAQ